MFSSKSLIVSGLTFYRLSRSGSLLLNSAIRRFPEWCSALHQGANDDRMENQDVIIRFCM